MPIPWFTILDALAGLTDVARRVTGRSATVEEAGPLAVTQRGTGALEARLAGVVVAALKEAFDRDNQRMDLEREQIEAERQRAERALRLELVRQAGDREVARQRLIAGVAVASLLGTLFFSGPWLDGGAAAARVALGGGWLLLLAALSAAFLAQSHIARALGRPEEQAAGAAPPSSGPAGTAAPWLIVAGLAVIAFGVLLG